MEEQGESKQDSASKLPNVSNYNRPEEVDNLVTQAGQKKAAGSIDRTFYLGFLAGLFVACAGLVSISAAGGT